MAQLALVSVLVGEFCLFCRMTLLKSVAYDGFQVFHTLSFMVLQRDRPRLCSHVALRTPMTRKSGVRRGGGVVHRLRRFGRHAHGIPMAYGGAVQVDTAVACQHGPCTLVSEIIDPSGDSTLHTPG